MKHICIIIAVTLSVFLFTPSLSQNQRAYSKGSVAEKIYLQLDSKVYTKDNTIWFKAIVTNSIIHTPSFISGVLYAELIGPNEKIIEKKLIKIQNGIGEGFFELSQVYLEGTYMIRAYTEWNKNFGSNYFYKEYIHVYASSIIREANPINNVTLIEKQNHVRQLVADLDPYIIDSLHKKDVTVFITADNKNDTLVIKKGKDNRFRMHYILSKECQLVTMQIQTKNHFNYYKTIALDENHLDLQFFPESGDLVHGIPSKVGFKALDFSGKGKKVEGEIINAKGTVVTHFKSNSLGMGSFTLFKMDSTYTYFARVTSEPQKEGISVTYTLPEVARKGNVLSVSKIGKELRLVAFSNYLTNDSVFFRVSCRGRDYYEFKGKLKDGVLSLLCPVYKLQEGIIAITMLDSSMHPLAERLYFNERLDDRLNISISTNQEIYSQRKQTVLDIKTTNNIGEAVNANLSVLVLNDEQLGQMQDIRQNILSYFLLSSDLKGEIENPGSYFNLDNSIHKREHDLDALMLTQGWSKYNYTKPEAEILFQPEASLTVKGTVSGALNKKKKKVSELTMMTFGQFPSAQSQITDSLGRFRFNINDEYGQNINLIIQSAKKTGKKQDYTITLDKKESPDISYDQKKSVEKADSIVHEFVAKNIERKQVEESFRLSSDIYLDEVVIEDYRITPERKKVFEKYGKPDQVISGQSIREKEENWSYGLYSVLLFKFPGKIRIIRTRDFLYAQCINPEVTLVVIDGIPVMPYDYSLIPNIPPSEVKTFEIIEYAKNFRNLFMHVFPEVHPLDVPTLGNVIAIYTYAGKGIHGVSKPIGLQKKSIQVFSVPREFYAPKYEKLTPDEWINPDLRALVHWEPIIKVDNMGRATTSFYNADNVGKMLVVVEAISDKGEIGYQKFIYNVKKRKNQ